MTGSTLALLLQFCVMSHQDIYNYTLPNVNTYQCGYLFKEANPVLEKFQESGLDSVYFVGSGALVAVVTEKIGDLGGRVLMAGLTAMEVNSIHSWGRFGIGPREVNWEFARLDF